MSQWSLDLEKWAAQQKTKMEDVRRYFAFAMYAKIVMRTPVDKGGARQNWLVTLNNQTSEVVAANRGHYLDKGKAIIDSAKGDEKIIFQNNLPYIEKIEYGGYGPKSPTGKTVNGFSKQAPQGMLGISMLEAGATLTEAISEVGK